MKVSWAIKVQMFGLENRRENSQTINNDILFPILLLFYKIKVNYEQMHVTHNISYLLIMLKTADMLFWKLYLV